MFNGKHCVKFLLRLVSTSKVKPLGFHHFHQSLQPKFLPPSRREDKFLIYSYTLFVTNPKYHDLVSDVINTCSNKLEFDNQGIEEVSNLEKEVVDLVLKVKRDSSLNIKNEVDNLDIKSVFLTSKMNVSQFLKILSSFHILLGLQTFDRRLKFFARLPYVWKRKNNKITPPQLIMILFFATQAKSLWIKTIPEHLDAFKDKISLEEYVIICHCFFKLKMKLSSGILNQICKLTLQNLNHMDTYSLVTILKALRYANFWDLILWQNLANFAIKNVTSLNFSECTHFLSAFANVKYYDKSAFEKLEKRGVFLLEDAMKKNLSGSNADKIHGSLRPRSKDIARFLWALSHVHHDCSKFSLEIFTKGIEIIVASDHKNPKYLIDSLVSLSIFNIYPNQLISSVFETNFVQKCLNLTKSKPLHQLHYLNFSSAIENPQSSLSLSPQCLKMVSNKLNRPLYKELNNRENLRDLMELFKKYFNATDEEIKCLYLLPHIQISSIIISNPLNKLPLFLENSYLSTQGLNNLSVYNLISVELFDNSVCAYKNHDKPIGLLITKIRQLKRLGVKVVGMTPKLVNECKNNPERINETLSNFL